MSSIERIIRRTDGVSPIPQPERQSGGNMMRDMIIDNISRDAIPQGIMNNSIAQGIMNNPIVGTIMEGYDKIENYIPKNIDTVPGMSGKFYGYDIQSENIPGTITLGLSPNLDQFYGGINFSFEDGGIVNTEQAEEMLKEYKPFTGKKQELTDEQKDYLYDFMLDFMFKQKQKEQQEMDGRVPMFNYFDMEV